MEGLWCGWCKRLPMSQGQTLGDIEEEPRVRRGVIRQAGSRAAGDNGTGRSMGQQDFDGNSVAVRIDFSDVHARSRAAQGRDKSLDPSVFGNHKSHHHAGEGERGGEGEGERRAAGGSGRKSRHRTSDVDEEILKLAGFTPPPKSSLMTGAAPPSPSKSSRSAPTPTPGSPAKRPAMRQHQRTDDAPELRAALAKAAAAAGGGDGMVIKPTPSSDGSKASSTRSTKASSRDGPGSWFGMKSALEGIGVSSASAGSAAPSSSSSSSWLGGLGIPAPLVGGWQDMLGGIGGFGSPKEKEEKSLADKEVEEEEELNRKRQPPQLEIPSPTANSVGSASPRKQKKLPPIVLETEGNHHLMTSQLSAEEVDKISGALEDMAVSGVITFEEEKHMLDKVAECNPQLLMAWTVFQCNGNEKRFVQTIKSIA